MRILVCGDRNYTDRDRIKKKILQYVVGNLVNECFIICGGAGGADTLAKEVGEELGFHVIEYKAEWIQFGRSAGPKRNKRMLVEGQPDFVLAFHDDIEKSKGTLNMLKQSLQKEVPVTLYEKKGWVLFRTLMEFNTWLVKKHRKWGVHS